MASTSVLVQLSLTMPKAAITTTTHSSHKVVAMELAPSPGASKLDSSRKFPAKATVSVRFTTKCGAPPGTNNVCGSSEVPTHIFLDSG